MIQLIKTCLVMIMFIMMFTGCASARVGGLPEEVAYEIKGIIARRDVDAFKELFADMDLFSERDVEYYFGVGDESRLREFMSRPAIAYKLFFRGQNEVTVLYFDARLSPSPKVLDWEVVGRSWLSSYAAVDLVRTDRGWLFEQTPFFFFRHVPWADDY